MSKKSKIRCGGLIYLISFVLVMGLISDASAELVAHWKLDEVSGTTAVDATGNGHDGTLIGNPQWTDGYFAGGLKFAGSPDKVDVPQSAELNPENAFTVTVWANLDPGGSGYRSPVTSRDDSPQRGYIIYCTPGNTWEFWTGNSAGGWDSAGSPPVALGEWTHVAATYSNGEKKLYINGELAGESSATMPPNTVQVLRIGAGATEGDGNYFFVGTIDDVRIYNHALSADEVSGSMLELIRELASEPFSDDGATDVPRDDVMLSWRPGVYAVQHDVYIGTNFDDVNNATTVSDVYKGRQDTATFALDRLELSQTYYWRVDEVNAPPDSTIFKGITWSFTTEPVAYAIENITATASSTHQADTGPENTINGSGLDANDLHSIEPADMWLSGDEPNGAWIEYEFDKVHKLHQMWVWNHNGMLESVLGFGLKDVTIEYSTNGTD
ncbi:MAG: hypothetical protein IIB56_15865, partial [Planctomycetes bacterium]|nr:hypothetical protein [Planctomycetota bacterium]